MSQASQKDQAGIRSHASQMKRSFSRSELANALGMNKETIRFYEQQGFIHPARSDNGYRRYSYDDFRTLLDIAAFQSGGFRLKDVRRVMLEQDLETNRKNFATEISAERELVKKHMDYLDALEKSMHLFDKVQECLGTDCVMPLEKHYVISLEMATERRDLLNQTFFIERYEIRADGSICFAELLPCIPEWASDAGTHFVRQGSNATLERSSCYYTVIESKTRTPEPNALGHVASRAAELGYNIGTELFSNYIVVAAGVCYCEIYVPLR
jgi:DNA-binding transcriptional MerR regulator